MTDDKATGIAARLWCKPEHSYKVMDPDFCKSIADTIRPLIEALEEIASREGDFPYAKDVKRIARQALQEGDENE